jgi:2-methylisocitrate lyase-like PEP mutase family enzyme
MSVEAQSLRSRLAAGTVVAPGCYDALSAALVAQAGFTTAYLSGASLAYTRLGRPDIGLVTASEVVDTIALIRDRNPDLSLVVDADTGFGNAINVQRTTRTFERAGASALQLEDQLMPKRCGHLTGKRLIDRDEMVGKVKAALDARKDESTLIVARTDAIACEGFDRALERAWAYVEAGADILFVEAPQSSKQLEQIAATFGKRIPLVANMVEGGMTPLTNVDELSALGFRLVIFPGAAVRVVAFALGAFLEQLKATGSSGSWRDRMHDLGSLNAILGTPALLETAERYDPDRMPIKEQQLGSSPTARGNEGGERGQ